MLQEEKENSGSKACKVNILFAKNDGTYTVGAVSIALDWQKYVPCNFNQICHRHSRDVCFFCLIDLGWENYSGVK